MVLAKGQTRTRKLDVTHTFGNGVTVRFWGPEPLGPFDLRVMQGLVALAGTRGMRVRAELSSVDVRERKALEAAMVVPMKGSASDADDEMLYLKECYARIAVEIGVDPLTSKHYAFDIRRTLERLYATTVIVDRDGERRCTRMISTLVSSERRAMVWVALNAYITQAVLGGDYARIAMEEVRALRNDVARVLHQRLSALIFPGERRRFSMKTLVGYSYVEDPKLTLRALSKRRAAVIKAMQELQRVGWAISASAGVYQVARPS